MTVSFSFSGGTGAFVTSGMGTIVYTVPPAVPVLGDGEGNGTFGDGVWTGAASGVGIVT